MSRTDHHGDTIRCLRKRTQVTDRAAIAEQVAVMLADDWQVENQGAFGAGAWDTWDMDRCECDQQPVMITSESPGYQVPRHSVLIATQPVRPRRVVQHVPRRDRVSSPVWDMWREQTSPMQMSVCE